MTNNSNDCRCGSRCMMLTGSALTHDALRPLRQLPAAECVEIRQRDISPSSSCELFTTGGDDHLHDHLGALGGAGNLACRIAQQSEQSEDGQ
jgi:hypothetical protein